jgi:hypothetical protein
MDVKRKKTSGIVSVHENITGIFVGKYYVMDDQRLISVFFEFINKLAYSHIYEGRLKSYDSRFECHSDKLAFENNC